MASSDEDDIDALRNAALASMKNKFAAQEPQGIQVLSLGPSQTYKEPGEEEFQSEFHQIPPELQHALSGPGIGFGPRPYNNGPLGFNPGRGRGFPDNIGRGWGRGGFVRANFQRGYQRGRGGRGRGFNKRFPGGGNQLPMFRGPPPNQSALIVIQVEGSENKQERMPKTVKQSSTRMTFLRPQDKWASPEGAIPCASPPRPKDTSKFRRYDDDTDSDEEDELMEEEEDEDQNDNNSMMPANDVEVQPDVEAEWAEAEVEIHNQNMYSDEEDMGPSGDGESKRIVVDTHQIHHELEDKSDSETQPILHSSSSDLRIVNRVVQDSNDGTGNEEIDNVNESVSKEGLGDDFLPESSANKDTDCEVRNATNAESSLGNDKNVDVPGPSNLYPDDQEDSVSNSNYKFSRFDRGNRRDSESGEGSDIESEGEDSQDKLNSSEASKSLSDISFDDNLLEGEEEKEEMEDIDDVVHVEESKTSTGNIKDKVADLSVEVKQTQAKDTDKKNADKTVTTIPKTEATANSSSASSSDSSSSGSSSSSSDSSDSSDSESSSPSSLSRHSSNKSKTMHKSSSTGRPSEGERVKPKTMSSSQRLSDHCGNGHSKSSSRGIKSENEGQGAKSSVKHPNKSDRGDKHHSDISKFGKLSRESKTYKSTRSRSPSPRHKRIEKNEVQAAPEFDAANYRDESMFRVNSKKKTSVSKSGKRANENVRDTEPVTKYTHHKGEMEKEPRHFKEISRLKDEHSKSEKGRSTKTVITDESKNRRDSKHKPRDEGYVSRDRDSRRLDNKTYSRDSSRSNRQTEAGFESSDSKDRGKTAVKKSVGSTRPTELVKDKLRPDYQVNHKDKDVFHKGSRKSEKLSAQSLIDSDRAKYKQQKDRMESKSRSIKNESSRVSSTRKKSSDSLDDKELRRKSIEERLKKIADINVSSDSDSDKSVSSLSDMSSDSESESWRNKKAGASRKTDDIEQERRRRRVLERETQRRNREMKSDKSVRDRSDRSQRTSPPRERNQRSHDHRHTDRAKTKSRQAADYRETYYHKKNMVFVEEEAALKKAFHETFSESDSEGRVRGGVTSVVKTNSKGRRTEVSKLPDLHVSRPVSVETGEKMDSYTRDSGKKERLVIQVQGSDDEEKHALKLKKDKKKTKLKKEKTKKTVDLNEYPEEDRKANHRDQVVKLVFKDDTGGRGQKSKPSVYDRLGLPGNMKEDVQPAIKRSKSGIASSGKRIKLSDGSKYVEKPREESGEESGGRDAELNRRIRKIQEKNAEILRRKHEVEQDKERYG